MSAATTRAVRFPNKGTMRPKLILTLAGPPPLTRLVRGARRGERRPEGMGAQGPLKDS
jgi:hypothetical protein